MESSGHTLPYQSPMRAAPPSGPPPMYARTLQRVYPYSLRPVIIFTSLLSFIYLLVFGVGNFRSAENDGVSGKLKTFDIVQAILFLAAAAVELLGFFAAYTQRLPLARLYSFASLVAFGAVVASEIIGIVVNYTLKTDVIDSCTTFYTGSNVSSGFWWSTSSQGTPMTEAEANTYCQSQWSSDRTWDFVWLVVTFILGALFVSFSFGYVRQMLDPNSVRIRRSRLPFQRQGPAPQREGLYDTEAAFSYPPNSGHNYNYPPPPGAPPMGPGAPPLYTGRGSLDDDYDGDAKSPAAYGYGYNYGPDDHENPFNRPGSSRNVAMHPDDEDDQEPRVKKDSGETLRGEDSVQKGTTVEDEDDHATPRI